MPVASPLLEAFDGVVRRCPDAPLIVQGGRIANPADVDAWARRAAGVLEAARLPQGSLVGLAAPRGPAFLAGVLALRRRGLAALLLDPRAPRRQAEGVVRALGAAATLRCAAGWPAGEGNWSLSPGAARPAELPGIAFVKLSSGSSGEPRGIAAREEALLADDAALARSMGIRTEDRLLSAIPLSHSYGFSSLVLPALLRGTRLVMPDGDSPLAPLEAARVAGATVFPTTPAYLQGLLRLQEPPPLPPTLRLILSAGAPLSRGTARAFRERCGKPVHVFYGASECGGICYDRTGTAAERGTVGTPLDGVEVRLGARQEEVCGALIEVRSAAVAHRSLPEADGRLADGVFRSDDLGRWEGDELVLVGRAGDWINVDGRKVNPREIERVLRQMEGVDEVFVCGIREAERSIERIGALIAGDPAPEARDVRAWCRERLAPHQVPRIVRGVREIPRTARGKADRAAVRALLGDVPEADG